jgi:hypothetical protein
MVLLLHPRPAPVASLAELATGYWLWLLVVLVVIAVAQRMADSKLVDRGLDRLLGLPPEPLWPVQRPRSFPTWWLVFDLGSR